MRNLLVSTRRMRVALAATALGCVGTAVGTAQQTANAPGAQASKPGQNSTVVQTAIPAKPSDPIAVVNGEVITRGQLADECVSRYGVEVLETLVARTLLQQAVVQKKLQISAAEIQQEIDRNAGASGLSREQFLRMLAKERNISPRQYADYIAYPSLALRKLAEPRVQVTEKDMDEAFQANFGEKLQCRVIMVDTMQKAKDTWNEVRTNPGGFAKIAQERSIDPGTRALGGLLAQPIVRFAHPRHVSEAAFQQLVDGDEADKDPTHKPKDGDFTGPIQVSEGVWIILKRESLEAGKEVDRSDPNLRQQLQAQIAQAKLDAEMQTVMEELMFESAIDNHLTGQTKLAKKEEMQLKVDQEVERSSSPAPANSPQNPAAATRKP